MSQNAQPLRFKRNIFVLAIASFSQAALAEEEINLETVRVVGQAAQISKALDQQRNSNSIESVIHADDIGQLPDDNAAEALQRLPGVSVENDQGEGRFVTVRGLAPELNAVTINGTLVPSPEAGTRAVALDVLPSELVQSLSVVKTLTPDMDANSLGGTVNVQTLSGFDHDGLFYTTTIEGSHDTNIDKTSPKASGAISDVFDLANGQLGIAAAVSWQEREFGSDNVEAEGNWDFDSSPVVLEKFEMRDYEIIRERTGLGLNFDYRSNNYSSYFLRTQYSEFRDAELRQRAKIDLDANETERDLKDREETQTISSFVLGGEKTLGNWTINAQAGYARSDEENPDYFSSSFVNDNTSNSYSGTKIPGVIAAGNFADASSYEFDELELSKEKTTDTEKNIKLDLAKAYTWNDYDAEFKFGGKISRRVKDNEVDVWEYDAGASGLTLVDFSSGNVDYGLSSFGPSISSSAIRQWASTQTATMKEDESRIGDYEMQEDINAAYLMNTVDLDKWTIITGLRYEHTDFDTDGTRYDADSDEYSAVNESNDYGNWLPGLHVRYYVSDNTQIRSAYTQSVVRPTFEALAPGIIIDGSDAEFGNPNLDPLESNNYDLGIEHYIGKDGAISAFVFYKDIENFVYNTDLAGTGIWTGFDEALTYANGDEAEVYGIELAYTQKLSSLPSPWNGLIVGANVTLSSSDAEISGKGNSRNIELPGQSDRVGNVMLGWENDTFSMRLSANYKSEYLSQVSDIEDKRQDIYVDDQTFVDFNMSYFLAKNLHLTFEAKNITDEVFYRYQGSKEYNAQYEEYGPSFKLSLTLTNF